MASDLDPEQERNERRNRRSRTLRVVAIAVLGIVATGLALDNRRDVTVGWIIDDRRAPLVIVLAVAFVLGLAIGWLLARRRR